MKYSLVLLLFAAVSCKPPAGPSPVDAARASARRHSRESLQILELVSRRIEDFFSSRRDRVEALTDELFSLQGKWRALAWGREDFERHVRRRFEEHVFRPEDVERELIGPVRDDLAFAIDACEAGVAADLNQWARSARPGVAHADLRPALSPLVAGLVLEDLGLNLASFIGSEAAAVTAASVLTRVGLLGASAAAGGGTAWATLGIGLVVGTIAGLVIDAVVGEELEETARDSVRSELDALRRKLMESPDGLWHAARRALDAHGKALEKSAAILMEGAHGSRGA
jgi:hypothetical protein